MSPFEQQAPRPTSEQKQEKVEGYLQTKQMSARRYQETLDELRDLMSGRGDQEVREQYYLGWQEEDFKDVLRALGEEVE